MDRTTRRVTLNDPAAQATAEKVAAALAAQLQRGGDALDADAYDAWFAADILWGSPFGATLAGFEPLNAIHHRLMGPPAAPSVTPSSAASVAAAVATSRFEVVSVLAPAPGVVVTHIQRRALAAGAASRRWPFTSWWNATATGGLPQPRTPRSARGPPVHSRRRPADPASGIAAPHGRASRTTHGDVVGTRAVPMTGATLNHDRCPVVCIPGARTRWRIRGRAAGCKIRNLEDRVA